MNRRTGRVWVKRIVCAHDCGLVINPEALTRTLEGGLLHRVSRALYEEARFDTEKMTERRLGELADADARRRAGADRHRPGQRRSESEPSRSAALRRGRDDVQADAGGGRQCGVRCDRRAHAARAVHGDARCWRR